MKIKQLPSALITLLYPRRCPVCGQIVAAPDILIHSACLAKLSLIKQPSCKRCGKEVFSEAQEYCYDCVRHRRSFDAGAALLNYNQPARQSMMAVKYHNRREYLDFYAEAMDLRFRHLVEVWQPELLIPVPVHPSRRRQRGFNQAEELALRLAGKWDIPAESGLLLRNKKTLPQRELNPKERLENLRAAFEVRAPGRDIPRRVLLIDDIYTTGSTIEACTHVLKAAGVNYVCFLTICTGLSC
ncbi:MAG: ComF family protein [Lachnospiraceae bacterium]